MHSVDKLQNIQLQNMQSSQPEIDIIGQNLQYFVDLAEPKGEIIKQKGVLCFKKFEKHILKGVDVIFKSGEVSAIMGASGAGKTTLLNVLACRVDQSRRSGKIYANNESYDYERFGDFANYVMQNDILFQTLTVKETLQFAANLKLNLPNDEKQKVLDDLIKSLKLEKCVDVPIGGSVLKGISGGQKKRTNIAFELISDPAVIFLDEPTSGLDSLTAFIIIKHLKRLAHHKRKTVIFTIHQPSSQIYAEFDKLVLMVQGKLVYQGPASQTVNHFAALGFKCPQFHNPADFFMSIIHHESEANRNNYPKYFDAYQKQQLPKIRAQIEARSSQPIPSRKEEVSVCMTIKALVIRDIINIKRNPIVARARMAQAVILSVFSGGVFFGVTDFYNQGIQATARGDPNASNILQSGFGSIVGAMFFLTITTLMSSLSPVSLTFPIEKEVFLKERGARLYSTPSYFFSRNVTQLPFMVLAPLIMSAILYWMFKMDADAGKFFTFFAILFFTTIAGASLGLLVGSVVPDPKLVSVMIPIFILPLIIFGGFYKNRGDLPGWIGWIQYISPNKYGLNALVLNQFGNQAKIGDSNPLVSRLAFDLDLWPAALILLGVAIAIRLLSLFFLIIIRRKLQ